MTGSAKQSIAQQKERMDCFVASAPRNDSGLTTSFAVQTPVELRIHQLAANSFLDATDGQMFMGYFRRTGLDRTADMKPVFPDARLNQFKRIFDSLVTQGIHCPFGAMSNNA